MLNFNLATLTDHHYSDIEQSKLGGLKIGSAKQEWKEANAEQFNKIHVELVLPAGHAGCFLLIPCPPSIEDPVWAMGLQNELNQGFRGALILGNYLGNGKFLVHGPHPTSRSLKLHGPSCSSATDSNCFVTSSTCGSVDSKETASRPIGALGG